jgi:environmental stress-induced protein Ves
VSVADITQDGPFSAFPGIDRCFTVLEGAGVALMLDGQAVDLVPGDDPLRFDGAAAPGCRLLHGPTRDLNLMVRASAGRAAMTAATVGAPWRSTATWRGLYVHGAAEVDFGAGLQTLSAAALVWQAFDAPNEAGTESDHPVGWTLIRGGPAWWLWMEPLEHPT